MEPACFNQTSDDPRPHTVYIIGDWGGVMYSEWAEVMPADRRAKKFKKAHRVFIHGADDIAQQKVANQMKWHAAKDRVDYILNVGDNFYWGGIQASCSMEFGAEGVGKQQWTKIYEWMYNGETLKDKQWLGVLGNHDYGGWNFLSAWDQTIAYTWGGEGTSWRWFQPALYYKAGAIYEDFSIDYFFIDSNVFDALDPYQVPGHNICSSAHNPENKGCPKTGPYNIWQCKWWFIKIWKEQMTWIETELEKSVHTTDWQIVVTHFPPNWGVDHWAYLCEKYGIDVYIAGHVHNQQLWSPWGPVPYLDKFAHNPVGATAVVVSGGGGGITSEGVPSAEGWDNEYGFMKMQLAKDEIIIRHVSHGGQLREEIRVNKRLPQLTTTNPPTTVTATIALDMDMRRMDATRNASFPDEFV